jgi:hypothetical protein
MRQLMLHSLPQLRAHARVRANQNTIRTTPVITFGSGCEDSSITRISSSGRVQMSRPATLDDDQLSDFGANQPIFEMDADEGTAQRRQASSASSSSSRRRNCNNLNSGDDIQISSNQSEKAIVLHFTPTRRGVSVQQLVLCGTQLKAYDFMQRIVS